MANNLKTTEPNSEKTKSQRVYSYLRRRIRGLEIPPGTALSKNDIALECDVSRAPVSEAIARLSAEGLVDVFPQSGSFVSPIRLEDIREAMFIRTALEVEAVRRVTQDSTSDLIERLQANIQAQKEALESSKLDAALYDDLDEALHAEIISALNSARAQQLLEEARVMLDRPRFLAIDVNHRPEETFAEHCRIVDAIGTGDPELAAAAMRVHLAKVAAAIEKMLVQIEEKDEKTA
jgi:DNA-binding GntR family transcriptional regulator